MNGTIFRWFVLHVCSVDRDITLILDRSVLPWTMKTGIRESGKESVRDPPIVHVVLLSRKKEFKFESNTSVKTISEWIILTGSLWWGERADESKDRPKQRVWWACNSLWFSREIFRQNRHKSSNSAPWLASIEFAPATKVFELDNT